MTNDEFIRYAKGHIRDYLPPDFKDSTVRVTKIVKPNDESYTGMCLMKPNKHLGPQIPLEEYAAMQREGRSLDDVMIEIAEEITRFRQPVIMSGGDNIAFGNLDEMKHFLTTKLCDAVDSVEYLSDKPWTPVGETWGLLYRLKLLQGEDTVGSAPVTNTMLSMWGIDLPTLHRMAVENESSNDPAWMFKAGDVMTGKITNTPNMLDGGPIQNLRSGVSYFLSNKSTFNGACVVGWEGVLDRVGDVLGRNFYVVPTSIHEVMIVPDFSSVDPANLIATLQWGNGNSNIVQQSDILSGRIQRYDRRRHKLETPARRLHR